MAVWRNAALRVAALLLVAVVCADILDAGCDPIDLPGSASAGATLSPLADSNDACTRVCVPDCFCCSRSETAGAALTLPPLTLLADAPFSAAASVPATVRDVAELPPLSLS